MVTANVPRQKLSFDNGGAFIRETRRDVEAWLADRRVAARGRRKLQLKAAISFALLIGSWTALIFAPQGVAVDLLYFAGVVAGTMLVAFSVMHDANHGAYFRSRRLNHLLGWTADVALGVSSYAWRVKHNIAHHTYTNVDGYDADITQTPIARMMPTQEPRPWYRFQHLYVWPLYTLMMIRWQIAGDITALSRGRIGHSTLRWPRGWDLAGITAGKAVFLGWTIVVPLFVFPWWLVLPFYVLFTMIIGLVTATTFQLAHCVEEADFVAPAELAETPRIWAVHEVESTVNFCPRNGFLTWALGGLNFQIEHHLFPRVPHTQYPHIAEIVRRNCARHGVRYTSQPTLRAALGSHQRHLRALGRSGRRLEIEMG